MNSSRSLRREDSAVAMLAARIERAQSRQGSARQLSRERSGISRERSSRLSRDRSFMSRERSGLTRELSGLSREGSDVSLRREGVPSRAGAGDSEAQLGTENQGVVDIARVPPHTTVNLGIVALSHDDVVFSNDAATPTLNGPHSSLSPVAEEGADAFEVADAAPEKSIRTTKSVACATSTADATDNNDCDADLDADTGVAAPDFQRFAEQASSLVRSCSCDVIGCGVW
jgi:hypothetical protein